MSGRCNSEDLLRFWLPNRVLVVHPKPVIVRKAYSIPLQPTPGSPRGRGKSGATWLSKYLCSQFPRGSQYGIPHSRALTLCCFLGGATAGRQLCSQPPDVSQRPARYTPFCYWSLGHASHLMLPGLAAAALRSNGYPSGTDPGPAEVGEWRGMWRQPQSLHPCPFFQKKIDSGKVAETSAMFSLAGFPGMHAWWCTSERAFVCVCAKTGAGKDGFLHSLSLSPPPCS